MNAVIKESTESDPTAVQAIANLGLNANSAYVYNQQKVNPVKSIY
jgi:hypothetical protein